MAVKRVYLNITNKCNRNCPFCCMWSGPLNDLAWTPAQYTQVLQEQQEVGKLFNLHLLGGEPLTHPNFIAFVEEACQCSLVASIVVTTNGVLLSQFIDTLYCLRAQYKKQIVINVSINYYLLSKDPELLTRLKFFSTEYPVNSFWLLCLAIRHRIPKALEDSWLPQLEEAAYYGWAQHTLPLEFTGRAQLTRPAGVVVVKPHLLENIVVYTSDGEYYDTDFSHCKQHERSISNYN